MEPQSCIILLAKSCRCSLLLIDKNQTLAFFQGFFLIYVHQTADRNYIWSLLTARGTVLREKLKHFQLDKTFLAFYGTRRSITAFTSARQLSLSWATSIQSITPHPTFWRSFLILSYHLRQGSPKWSLSIRCPHQNLIYASTLPHTSYMPRPSHYSRLY